jgi:hypothetical protein
MEQQGVRKTYKHKLKPTPKQEQMLEHTLMLCRHVYNAAVGERREAWRLRGVAVTYYQQKAELPGIKEAMPEYGEVNAQVLQDVVLRVDRAFDAFFRRLQEGQAPDDPRFHGRNRYTRFTYPQVGNMAAHRLITAFSSCRKSGGLPYVGVVPWRERPGQSRSVGKWMVGMSASRAPMCRYTLLPLPDRKPA